MELSVNLPFSEIYKSGSQNNLSYWGVDYPPLTVYHSFILGKVKQNFFGLSICTEEPRAGSFLKQRISLAIQIANAACVLGTINDKITFDEIFYL